MNYNEEIIEDIYINASSVSKFGNCLEKYSLHNYIFKNTKNQDGEDCFICVLLYPRTINAVQIVYDKNNICYKDIAHARMSCFESTSVTANLGYFLFKEEDSRPVSCEINGIYNAQYHEIGSNIICNSNKSMNVENCKYKETLSLSFPNCQGINIQKSYFCLGNFKDREMEEYTLLFDLETGKHMCARRMSSENTIDLFVRDSFDCIKDINNNEKVVKYSFSKEDPIKDKNVCTFPEYLNGDFDTFKIEKNVLTYKKSADNYDNLQSYCVAKSGSTFLVKTIAECGIPLAYNCFHFTIRSPVVMQIKIKASDVNKIEECLSYVKDNDSLWVTASKKSSFKSHCGFEGSWATLFDHSSERCFNVDVKSPDFSSFDIVGFNCKDNSIFQSKSYECIANWKDNDKIYLYTKDKSSGINQTNSNVCFLLQNIGSKIMLTKVGSQCLQSYNLNQTLTMEQKLSEPSLISTPLIEIGEDIENDMQGNMNDMIDDDTSDKTKFIQEDDHSNNFNKTNINLSTNIYYLTNTIACFIICFIICIINL
uniref:C-type lectin domain-containing protein n=1 Tax=Parastrongyloides trichosuri TaxID=131310 RepID=A0A0N5A421_PARTI